MQTKRDFFLLALYLYQFIIDALPLLIISVTIAFIFGLASRPAISAQSKTDFKNRVFLLNEKWCSNHYCGKRK